MEQPNVTFQTDHSALTSLQRKRVINNSRLAHWVTTMAEFEYTVEYIPGDSKSLDTADCLSRLIRMDEEKDPEKEKESTRWQYANCWTEVYAKLFDRLKADEVNSIVTNEGASTPDGGGGDQECKAGWYPEHEVPGCDSLCNSDFEVDVIFHIEEYTGVTEDVVQELKPTEGETCGATELCTSFENCYFNDYAGEVHGRDGGA